MDGWKLLSVLSMLLDRWTDDRSAKINDYIPEAVEEKERKEYSETPDPNKGSHQQHYTFNFRTISNSTTTTNTTRTENDCCKVEKVRFSVKIF